MTKLLIHFLWIGFVASEIKTIHTHPSPLPSKLGCLLFSTSSLNSGTTLHMEGMLKEKLHFSLLELAKCQKSPLGKSVSTNFVTNVAIIIHKCIKTFPLLIFRHSSLLRGRHLFIIAFQEYNGAIEAKSWWGKVLKEVRLHWTSKIHTVQH